MLGKTCKSVFVIVSLFFLVNFEVSATIGIIDIDTGRFAQGNGGVINVDIIDKSKSQIIVATLMDERGRVIDVVKLNNNFTNRLNWEVKTGTYKVLLVNVKSGEKEVHYVIL